MRGSFLEADAVHRPAGAAGVEESDLRAFPVHDHAFGVRSQRYRSLSLFELLAAIESSESA